MFLKSRLYFGIFFYLLAFSPPAFSLNSPFRVVIDPGHGGRNEGTVFRHGKLKITEKNITLKLARRIAALLRARHYFVTLTRNSDREISLPARTALANRLGADIFISIHMNSTDSLSSRDSSKKDPEGIETYILNNTTDASSRRLAHLENSVFDAQEMGNTPSKSDIALILKDLRLDANLSESKRLACIVQSNLIQATAANSRGVKQALFHVLLGADMPSILVEAGFLNNRRDRIFVNSKKGQIKISKAIAHAIDEYRKQRKAHMNSLAINKCKIN